MLENGERHLVDPSDPGGYEVHSFRELRIQLDAESLFPAGGPERGLRELTIPELNEQAAAMRAAGVSPHAPIIEAHKKFSIPVACFVSSGAARRPPPSNFLCDDPWSSCPLATHAALGSRGTVSGSSAPWRALVALLKRGVCHA